MRFRMMKSIIYLLVFQFVFMVNLAFASSFSKTENNTNDEAILLYKDFLEKIVKGERFLFEDGEKYFGSIPLPNLRTSLLVQIGFISPRGEWLKPKPKFSPLGELIRINRELIFQENDFSFRYLVGKYRFVRENDKIFVGSQYNIYAQVISKNRNTGDFGDLIGMQYVPASNSESPKKKVTGTLVFPLTVNGKRIMDDMGLIWKFPGTWHLQPEVAKRLEDILSNE